MGTTVFSSDFYLGYYGIDLAAFSGTFLTAANNLSDVASVPDSRTNLDVYSTAQVYSQTQLSTSGSSSVHWNNITNNVWSFAGGDIVASADVDLNSFNLLNVGTLSMTNITATGYVAAADFRQTTWTSGQDNSFITVDSADGGFDRLQLMYYTSGTPGLITADLDFDFTEDCTIGTSSSNTLDINSLTAIVANTTVYNTSGDGLVSTMVNASPTTTFSISSVHRSTSTNVVAWPLQLIHLTSAGSMTDDFGVGISFNIGRYGVSEYEIARINASRDATDNSGSLDFWVSDGGAPFEAMRLDYDLAYIDTGLQVGTNGGGWQTYMYGATGAPAAAFVISNSTSTSAMIATFVVKAETSGGAPGDGFGPTLKFQVGQETPTTSEMGQIYARYDGGTVNTEIGIAPTTNGIAQYKLRVRINEILFDADLTPTTNNSFDFGSTGFRLADIYAQNSINLGTGGSTSILLSTAGIQTDLDIVPFTDDTADLGSATYQFNTIWVHDVGSIATPIEKLYVNDIRAVTEITLGTASSGEDAPFKIVHSSSGEFAAIFESNSLLNDGNNGILIRAGSAGAGGNNDVFVMFENQNGVIVGGIEWTGSAFAFFVGTTPP